MPRTQIDRWPFLVAGLASQRVFTASSAGVDAAPDSVSGLNRVVSVLLAPAAATKEHILYSRTVKQYVNNANATFGIN